MSPKGGSGDLLSRSSQGSWSPCYLCLLPPLFRRTSMLFGEAMGYKGDINLMFDLLDASGLSSTGLLLRNLVETTILGKPYTLLSVPVMVT